MTEKKHPKDESTTGISRKEFLRRMMYGALGVAGLSSGLLPGMGISASHASTLQGAADDGNLLIVNARLIDGTGAIPGLPCSIRITNGVISEIGENLSAGNESVLDAQGATVMPGLIDSHVHLGCVPGSSFRGDDMDTQWALSFQHGKGYLAAGVTTVLDTGNGPTVLRDLHDALNNGAVGPRIYALGPPFFNPDGYLDLPGFLTENTKNLFPAPVATVEDVMDRFAEYEGIPNIIGVKVFVEKGMGPYDPWPIWNTVKDRLGKDIGLDDPRIDAIVAEAEKRNLPIWVHAMDEDEQTMALTMNPKVIAHVGLMEDRATYRHLTDLLESGVYVNSTMSAICLYEGEFKQEWYTTPLALLTVPEVELETASCPEAWELMLRTLYDLIIPDTAPEAVESTTYDLRRLITANCIRHTKDALKDMYVRGIPITLGSDAGYWPLAVNFFHGWSTIMEIEFMREAGMPLDAIIESSTRLPAEMMGISDKLGTVEVGKYGDLIVLDADPLSDIAAYRSLRWTIKGGVCKTPEQWMA